MDNINDTNWTEPLEMAPVIYYEHTHFENVDIYEYPDRRSHDWSSGRKGLELPIFILDVFIIAMLFVIGTVCNILALLVFKNQKKRTNMICYLMLLAGADTLFLFYLFIVKTIPGFLAWIGKEKLKRYILNNVLPYIWPLGCMVQTSAIYLVVMVTVDRYIAICRPMLRLKFGSKGKIKTVILVNIIGSIVFNIPRFLHGLQLPTGEKTDPEKIVDFPVKVNDYTGGLASNGNYTNAESTEFHSRLYNTFYETYYYTSEYSGMPERYESYIDNVYETDSNPEDEAEQMATLESSFLGVPSYERSILANQPIFRYIYYIVLSWLLVYIIPLITLFILNILLLLGLKKAKKEHAVLTKCATAPKKEDISITMNIVAIVTVFIVCQTPDFTQLIIGLKPFGFKLRTRLYCSSISLCFLALNCSVNFLIYCMFYAKFRKVAAQMFMCGVKNVEVKSARNGRSSNEGTRVSSNTKSSVIN